MVFFFGTFECTGKGYVDSRRGTSLAWLKREGGIYSGLALLASQRWWLFGTFECTGKGYVCRKGTSLASLEIEFI